MSSVEYPYIGTIGFVSSDPPTQTQQNAATLVQRAQTALANNQTFLGLTNPTNAQVLAQVRALTRQTNGLIRFLLNELDTITDS